MINLIPPQAKKTLKTEYWVRVLSVWFVLWSVALLAGIAILLPAYILIGSQVAVYQASAVKASEKVDNYASVSSALIQASQRAKIINDTSRQPIFSNYIESFFSMENQKVDISSMVFGSDENRLTPIVIAGLAGDRQSLATFRDNLLALDDVISVDLPISNLANDKDINFNMTVTVVNNETNI